MELHVRLEGRRELAAQIYQQIRAAILTGRLVRGERLPPTRELARRLDVSRNTIGLAYEWLVAEGLLSGRSGAGSFVDADPLARAPATRASIAVPRRRVWDAIPSPAAHAESPRYDFGVGMPDAKLFPYDTWRRLLARQIRPAKLDGGYGDPAGHPALRAAIARYAAVSRGVHASADDVIVTNGAQQAFDLIARLLLDAGARVAVEDPGYPPPRLLFHSMGARVSAVPVDEDGIDVTALRDDVRLVYVTPSHQFPLGMPMSHARRVALLDWAERRNAMIVEDDYDSEFRFGERPLEKRRNRGGRVIYVGSFSKSLLPSLRLGFLLAPPSLQAPLRAAAYVAGWYGPWPAQGALAALIDEGLLARHVRKMRRVYAERHDGILRTLTSEFPEWLEPLPSVTGLHVAAMLRTRSVDLERDLAARAHAAGIRFDRLSVYCAGKRPRAGLVLGYGGIATNSIAAGLRSLRDCFTDAAKPRRR